MSTPVVTLDRAPALLRRVDRAATVPLALLAVLLAALLAGRATGVRPLVERTGSMRPALSVGDLLVSHRVAADSLRRGDIVSFPDADHPGIPTTHRIVALQRRGGTLLVTTRGDANPASEQWTTPVSGTVRRVALSVPVAGRVITTLGGRWVRVALLLGACTGLATLALRRIWGT